MAAINIISNIGEVTKELTDKLARLADKEDIPRLVSFDVVDLMTKRIHIDGGDSSGGQIGTYSKDYLSLRQKKFKRSTDTKIIVSLTRQLENNWSVIATNNGYGVGFLNQFNYQKARWVEQGKNKKIFDLAPKEIDYITGTIEELTTNALK
jgi:hypothetical protein